MAVREENHGITCYYLGVIERAWRMEKSGRREM